MPGFWKILEDSIRSWNTQEIIEYSEESKNSEQFLGILDIPGRFRGFWNVLECLKVLEDLVDSWLFQKSLGDLEVPRDF